MNFRKSLPLCLVALLLLAVVCVPALAKVVSPGEDFFYLDKANVLSEALEGEIYFANRLLTEACGAQIVVVTLDTTGNQAIDTYTYNLLNEWGVGDASRNNGFVLLLAIGDDDYYASTGAGLTSKFSADVIKTLYDQYLEDDFAKKDYESGVRKFFEAAFARIAHIYNANVTIDDALREYNEYVAKNSAARDFGGYTGSRRSGAVNDDYRGYDDGDSGIGLGAIIFVVLIIVLIVVLSKGRRARRRSGVLPPPPPPPGGIGYRPTRTVYHQSVGPMPRAGGPSRPSRPSPSFGGGSSRTSFGGGSSRSSFGGGSGRSSFGGGSRSSGFGGGHGGGGRSAGGGAGRGRR